MISRHKKMMRIAAILLMLQCFTPLPRIVHAADTGGIGSLVPGDCQKTKGGNDGGTAKARREQITTAGDYLAKKEKELNQRQKDALFDMLQNCIKFINASFFSLSNFDFKAIIESIIGAIIQGVCSYAKDKQEELVDKVFDEFTYQLPGGLGVIGPDNTYILGQSMGGVHLTDWDSSLPATGTGGILQDKPFNPDAAAGRLGRFGRSGISGGGGIFEGIF